MIRSYEQTERFVNDSIVLRQFCRLYLESAPDDTTLIRWANQIGSETVVALNDRAVELARSLRVTRGRKLRVDAMVVETNVHHPTDSALLRDGVRVLSRLLRRAKDALPTQIAGRVLGREAFRTRNRSVRRVAQRLHRTKPGAKEKKPKRISKKPTESCSRSPGQVALRPRKSPKLCGNTPQAEPKVWWSAWSISYLWWSEGSTRPLAVSSKASRCRPPRSLSLFEEHTQIITRHKAGKPHEFGRKVLLDEVDGGIISRYEILAEAGSERSHLPDSLRAHRERFGRAPFLLAADRGLYSAENERAAHQTGVERVVLPKSGKLSEQRRRHEKQRWFRRGFRFRAGIEGRISVLGRVFGLDSCLDRGEEGMERWVGWGILAHNLRQTARRQVGRQAA